MTMKENDPDDSFLQIRLSINTSTVYKDIENIATL